MSKKCIVIGAVLMAIAVALGAVGSHILSASLPGKMLTLFELAVKYQIYHALGLMIIGVIPANWQNKKTQYAGGLMMVGIVLFCGGLYSYSLTDVTFIRQIIPMGGLALIASWLMLSWSMLTQSNEGNELG